MNPENIKSFLFDYCERGGHPGLWAEPLNAITNLFFILYGYFAVQLVLKQPDRRFRTMGDIWALSALLFAIGLGSGLWHTYAVVGWTVLVDIIPIVAFINLYIISLYRRVVGVRWLWVIAVWAVFTLVNQLTQTMLPPDTLNGSLLYLPTFAFMLLTSLYLAIIGKPQARPFALLTALFLLSLTFRTLDREVCNMLPIGTHFVWHILNAILLYGLLRLLIVRSARLP